MMFTGQHYISKIINNHMYCMNHKYYYITILLPIEMKRSLIMMIAWWSIEICESICLLNLQDWAALQPVAEVPKREG